MPSDDDQRAPHDDGSAPAADAGAMRLATVGHSVRPLDEFIALLRVHGVALLVDVRRFPASRRHPHFARESLARALPEAGIGYAWIEALGGRRSTRGVGEANAAWRVAAFRAYADHLQTDAGRAALDELEGVARGAAATVMCAEALWTRCHRRLIADAMTARGWRVRHLMTATRVEEHALPEFARVDGRAVTYPATWTV